MRVGVLSGGSCFWACSTPPPSPFPPCLASTACNIKYLVHQVDMDGKQSAGFLGLKRPRAKGQTAVTAALSVFALTALIRGSVSSTPWFTSAHGGVVEQRLSTTNWTWSTVRRERKKTFEFPKQKT
ncbi:hypothetical protein LX36DRAFT_656871, partial [Colletotrichum falcatum]